MINGEVICTRIASNGLPGQFFFSGTPFSDMGRGLYGCGRAKDRNKIIYITIHSPTVKSVITAPCYSKQ